MADNKENFAELKTLTTKENLSQEDTNKVNSIIEQIAKEIANDYKLTSEEFDEIRRFGLAHADTFKNAIGGLEDGLRSALLGSLQKSQEHDEKQETRGTPGKNDLKTIINKLHTANNRKEKKNQTRKTVKQAIVELNTEMNKRDISLSQLTDAQKGVLKKSFEEFPEELKAGFESISSSQLNDNFIMLFNEVTGSNYPTSGDREAHAKLSREFSPILNTLAAKYPPQNTNTDNNLPPITTVLDSIDDKEKVTKYILQYFPDLEPDNAAVESVVNAFQQAAKDSNISEINAAVASDDFITNFAVAVEGIDNLKDYAKDAILKQGLKWENQLITTTTAMLFKKDAETLTEEEKETLNSLLKTKAGITSIADTEKGKEYLTDKIATILAKPKEERTSEDLRFVAHVNKSIPSIIVDYLNKNRRQDIAETKEILDTKEENRTDEQKARLNELLKTVGGMAFMACYLADKDVKDLTDFEKEQLKSLAESDNDKIKDTVATRFQELTDLEANATPDQPAQDQPAQDTPAPASDAPAPASDDPAPASDDPAPVQDAPAVVLPDVTKEEVDNIINEIKQSEQESDYIKSIKPKLKKRDIEASLSFDTPQDKAIALFNPDDMLVAYDYIKNKQPSREGEMQEVIRAYLDMVQPEGVNPHNAFALNALIAKAGFENEEDEYKIKEKIAQGMKAFDQELIGTLGDEELATNYENAHNALENTFPDVGRKFLKDHYVLTEDDGKPITDKNRGLFSPARWLEGGGRRNDLSDMQDSIIEMARELVSQDLAKTGTTITDPDGKTRNLTDTDYEKMMQDKIKMLLGAPEENGKTRVYRKDLTSSMAGAMVQAEKFKARAKQKFKNGKLYKATTTWLERLDNRLKETFGKPYEIAKKAVKWAAKTSVNVGMGVARIAAISTVAGPIGVSAYLGYLTYNQWKNVGHQLKNKSKGEQTAIVAGNIISSTLTLGMAAMGLNEVAQGVGIDGGSVGQFISNATTQMGVVGRVAIVTAGNSMVNLVKGFNTNLQLNRVDRQLKNEKDPKKVKDLLDRKKELYSVRRANRIETVEKAASAALGTVVGVEGNKLLQNLIHGTPDQTNAAKPNGTGTEPADTTQTLEKMLNMNQLANGELSVNTDYSDLAQDLENNYGSKATEILQNVSQNPSEFLSKFSPEQLSDMGLSETSTGLDIAKALANTDNATILSEVHELRVAMATAAAEHGATVGANSAEQTAQNIEEAKNTRVHSSGRSVAEMLNDKLAAEAKHLGNLSVAEQQELSTKLQEIYGDKAYMAGTSAMAEPYTIVSELRNSMPAEDFAKLGFDNSITSIEVLKVLVDNPQLADNAGINKFMDTHFDAQQHFDWTPGVQPVQHTHTPTEPTNPENTQPDHGQGSGVRENLGLDNVTAIKGKAELMADDKGLATAQAAGNAENNINAQSTATNDVKTTVTQGDNQQVLEINAEGGKVKINGDINITHEIHIHNDTSAEASPTTVASAEANPTATATATATPTEQVVDPNLFNDATRSMLIDQPEALRPIDPPYGSPEYMDMEGFVYDKFLTDELNHRAGDPANRSHCGYMAVGYNPDTQQVKIYPNNPMVDDELFYSSYQEAVDEAYYDARAFKGSHPIGMNVKVDSYMRHDCYGSGYTTYHDYGGYGDGIHQAHRVMDVIEHGAETVEDLTRAGHRIVNFIDRISDIIDNDNRGHGNSGHREDHPVSRSSSTSRTTPTSRGSDAPINSGGGSSVEADRPITGRPSTQTAAQRHTINMSQRTLNR